MDTDTIGAIIGIAVFLYLVRWLLKESKEKLTLKDSIKKEKSFWRSLVIIPLVVAFISIFVFFFLEFNNGNTPPPEKKEQIGNDKKTFLNDMKHCEEIVNADRIDINNREFQRCNDLLDNFYNNQETGEEQCSGPYCW